MKLLIITLTLIAHSLVCSAIVSHGSEITKIAFGSCNKHNLPQPMWGAIASLEPDLFIFNGDVVYADTKVSAGDWRPSSVDQVRETFALQKSRPDYAAFLQSVPTIGVWDDHDSNNNDGAVDGHDFDQIKRIFLDFFDEPDTSVRRQRPGLYGAYLYGEHPNLVQIILLDVRTFVSEGSLLGEQQWRWLADRLRLNATNIVVSGIQVLSDTPIIDSWGRHPGSKERLRSLIAPSSRTLLVSGDVHFGEMLCDEGLIEVTSSGLTHSCATMPYFEWLCAFVLDTLSPATHRIVGPPFIHLNFGTITLNDDQSVTVALHNQQGLAVRSHTIRFDSPLTCDTSYSSFTGLVLSKTLLSHPHLIKLLLKLVANVWLLRFFQFLLIIWLTRKLLKRTPQQN